MQAIQQWLGIKRIRVLTGLFIATGLASTALQMAFPRAEWLLSAQVGLALLFVGMAALILSGSTRLQWRVAFTVLPALGAVLVGLLIPGLLRFFLGAALGWVLISQMLLRDTEKREYKLAVKALRKNDYPTAIAEMTNLIEKEPELPEHYAFRAQLHRLNNDLARATQDYEKAHALQPESAVGANGLAEICLQQNDLPAARHWADLAYRNAPQEWVALYNLGMIAERQQDGKAAAKYLRQALDLGIPESRHRLLAKVWLARSYHRQNKRKEAAQVIESLSQERKGLKEWEVILKSEESLHLRTVFQQDVRMAQALVEGQAFSDVFSTAG